MRREAIPRSCFNWKVKLPLKIKIFLSTLIEGRFLLKITLLKETGRGTRYLFCEAKEGIQHLYLTVKWPDWCGVRSPLPLGLDHRLRWAPYLVLAEKFSLKCEENDVVGVAAMCWSLWLTINDIVFQRTISKSFFWRWCLERRTRSKGGRFSLKRKQKSNWGMLRDGWRFKHWVSSLRRAGIYANVSSFRHLSFFLCYFLKCLHSLHAAASRCTVLVVVQGFFP
jgi:hypothetical protein